MHRGTISEAEYLHLDMPGTRHQPLEIDVSGPEGLLRALLHGGNRFLKRIDRIDTAHSYSAPPCRSLDQERQPDILRRLLQGADFDGTDTRATGQNRHTG